MTRVPGYRARGLGLVELMIALAIGAVIMAAVGQVYIGARKTMRATEELSRIQENGRFALYEIAASVRMAGYRGCASAGGTEVNIIADPAPAAALLDPDEAIDGSDSVPANTTIGAKTVRQGTDTLVLRHASAVAIAVADPPGAPMNANLKIENNALGLEQGDVVMVSDCVATDVFRITNNPGGGGNGGGNGDDDGGTGNGAAGVTLTHANGNNTDNRLSRAYGPGAKVTTLEGVRYFVAGTDRTDADGNTIHSLYRESSSTGIDPLVEGVENLQILYGEDTSGDMEVDRFVNRDDVDDITRVVAVRIEVLVAGSSIYRATAETQTFELADETITVTDRRLRKRFGTTISLRNRELLGQKL